MESMGVDGWMIGWLGCSVFFWKKGKHLGDENMKFGISIHPKGNDSCW